MPPPISGPQRLGLLPAALLITGCVSTPKPQLSHSKITAPIISTAPRLAQTPRPSPPIHPTPAGASGRGSFTSSPAATATLWNHLLRYAKNVAVTGQLYQANLTDQDEAIIDGLIVKDAALRTEQEQAILYVTLMEHAVVEYEFQREAAASHSREPLGGETGEAGETKQAGETSSAEGEVSIPPHEVLGLLAKEYAVNIAHEITANPYLNHPTIYHMSLNILSYIQADQSLLTTIIDHTQSPAQAWSMLHEAIIGVGDGSVHASAGAVPPDQPIRMVTPKAARTRPARQYSVGEFSEGDRIISRAKELHSQQLYKEALAQLTEITSQSPHYTEAQNLLQRYSDDAVNQLRGEAAKLYQAQLKVLNIQTKIEFLQEGEQKLLTALREYPESKWVSKVRNNLAVIQQKLDELAQVAAEAS